MKDKGFTLIEAVVTLALISILVTFVVPRVHMDSTYMNIKANEFVSDVRYIQSEVMKNPSSGYQIVVDSNEGKYYVKKNIIVEKIVIFKSRYKISYNNTNYVKFGFGGVPLSAGTFDILDTKTKKKISVSIVPATGRTTIKME